MPQKKPAAAPKKPVKRPVKTAAASPATATVGRLIDVSAQRAPAATLGRRSPQLAQGRPFLLLVYSEHCPHCTNMMPAWGDVVPKARNAGLDVVQVETGALQRCAPGESVIADAVRADPMFMGVPYIAMADPMTGGAFAHHDGERSGPALVSFIQRATRAFADKRQRQRPVR